MSGNTNYPTALDDDASLFDVTDNVSTLEAPHHNNLKEAIKALETRVGIYNTAAPAALDYRIGNPTGGHSHDGASGQGPQIDYNDLINAPVGGGVLELHPSINDRLRFSDTYEGIHAAVGTTVPTASDNTLLYLHRDGEAGLLGYRYLELGINNYQPGGVEPWSKHYFLGGWGVVLPIFATGALHATYSEKAQIFFDDQANKVKVWTGATWRSVAFE